MTLLLNPVIPFSIGKGCKICNGELEILKMMSPPAPDWLLDCINCKCEKGYVNKNKNKTKINTLGVFTTLIPLLYLMHSKYPISFCQNLPRKSIQNPKQPATSSENRLELT